MSSDALEGLPPVLVTAWGLNDPDRGRRRGLSVEAIVRAGIEIADAEGLGAVSMSRVSKSLGFSTMALYRHVTSKDDLLTLMLDGAAAEPPEPVEGESWRATLERWARRLFATYLEHPWMTEVGLTGPPSTPRSLLWLDRGLASMAGTRLGEGEKLGVMLLLTGLVRNEASMHRELSSAYADAGTTEVEAIRAYGNALRALVDQERMPALRRALEADVFAGPSATPDEDFGFALGRVLDGIERLIEARSAD